MVEILDAEKPDQTWIEQVETQFRLFALDKKSMDSIKAHQDQTKKALLTVLEDHGSKDDKGHLWIEFDGPVEGYTGMQRQRRVSQAIDDQATDDLLTERGLRGKCYKMVEVLDQDAVMALLYEGELTEADIDTMFPTTISYAFVPVKSK